MSTTARFDHTTDVPLSIRNRSAAQRRLRDTRSMVVTWCFSYSTDMPLGIGNRDAAQQTLPEPPEMPGGYPVIR